MAFARFLPSPEMGAASVLQDSQPDKQPTGCAHRNGGCDRFYRRIVDDRQVLGGDWSPSRRELVEIRSTMRRGQSILNPHLGGIRL
jgi:hypothetical protein